MSLTALFDRLGTLLPKYFLIGAVMPVLIFSFLNGLIAYMAQPGFGVWIRSHLLPTPGLFLSGVLLIGIAVTAYLLSTLNGVMRDLLEGKRFLSRFILLRRWQQDKLNTIEDAYISARDQARRIADSLQDWKDRVRNAAVIGVAQLQYKFDPTTSAAAVAIDRLKGRRKQLKEITFEEIEAAVAAMEGELRTNNIRKSGVIGQPSLSVYRDTLLRLFDYAVEYWTAEELRQFNERGRFGIGQVAPTALGNVGESMRAYGWTRYRIDLDTYWS